MINIAKISNEERKIIFQNVAYEMGINAAIVEKDYWVCLTLYFLFSKSSFKDYLVFKGGTCLSKIYKVIERFSEDIDLILDWRLLNYDLNEPWENRSNTKQLKFIEDSRNRLFSFLKQDFLPKFKKEFSEFLETNLDIYIDDSDAGIILFNYPKLYSNNSILSEIRLEIGALAEWEPQIKASLTPYVSDYYPQLFEVKDAEVIATTLKRSFWEKVTILHQEANRPENSKLPSRYSRHYYDVYCISRSGLIKYSKEDNEILTKVANFKSKFYPRNWARYDLARIGSIKLSPNENYIVELEKDYNSMQDMIYGTKPSFKELIDYIKQIEKEINDLK